MPRVSVVIPTYNRARFVTKAIDSVLEQTFRDFEIIVVNDGSTDKTEEVLQPYQDQIVYFSYQGNKGAAYARNRAIELAQGEYIAFLDSDDFWQPEKLEKQIKFFDKHPDYGLVATQCLVNVIDDDLRTIKYIKKEEIHYELTYEKIFQRPFIMPSSILIKKKCFDRVGFFDEELRVLEDIDIYLRLARKYKIGFINEPLTVYTRGHEKSRRNSLTDRLNRLKISERNYDPALISKRLYKKRISSLYAHIGKHYVQRGEIHDGKEALLNSLSVDWLNIRALKNYLIAIWREKLKKAYRRC